MRKGKAFNKILGIALVFVMIASMLGTLPSIARAAGKFNIGDTVEVTANLNVRTGPGTGYPEITDPDYPGYAPKGTIGKILSGPSSADGYIWWRVDFGPGLYSGWSVEDGLEKVSVINAEITSYSPSSTVRDTVPFSVTLTVTFRNTGNTACNFIAGATVWDANGNVVANYEKTLSTALQPAQQTTISWNHTVNTAGDYYLQFGVWKAKPYISENLLDKEPSPYQKLIVGQEPSVIDAEITSYSPSSTVRDTVPFSVTLTVTFRNTGNTACNFIAGATVWDANGNVVANYEKTLSTALQPAQQTTISWNHTVNTAGDYYLQFGVWKAKPYISENLLDKEPSPYQKLIVGTELNVTLTLYVHEGSASGPVLSGVRVAGHDGAGKSFDKTTGSSGYVTITGAPGTWHFSASKSGYETNTWDQGITTTCTRHEYLIPQPTINDQQKQQEILNMVNNHRGSIPPELVLAIICQEGGEGAFHVDGWNYNSFYRESDGPWAQPTNGDGIMQVTAASGYHERSGPYTHDRDGYGHAINDGCDYLLDLYNVYGSYVQTTLHYNTGPNSLYIYLGKNWGDRSYLSHVAGHLSNFVPSIYGLQMQDLADALRQGQSILNDYLYNKGIAIRQSVGYYRPYQTQLDSDLHDIGKEPDIPPTVVSTSPEDGATNVAIDAVVTATFSEAMDSSTITTDSFTLAGSAVSGTVTYDSDTYTVTFTLDANLDYDHEYTATLTTAITDEAGNPLAEPYIWRFITRSASPTPPDYFSEDWVEKGINWASNRIDKDNWKEYCMAFVSDAFKVCENRPASPNDLKSNLESAGKFYSKENGWDPPRGSLVFFSANPPYEKEGHIGISLADRKLIHAYQTVREETIADIESLPLIDSYLGWGYPPKEFFSPEFSNTFKKGDTFYKKEGWNLRQIPSCYGEVITDSTKISGEGEIIEDTKGTTDINGICNGGKCGTHYWWHVKIGEIKGWCAEDALTSRDEFVHCLIQQERMIEKDVPVNVDGSQHIIATLRRKIDPDTLRPIDNSGWTQVYIDMEGNPISDGETVRKIGLVELAQQNGGKVNINREEVDINEEIGKLKNVQSETLDWNLKDMTMGGINLAISEGTDIVKIVDEMAVIKRMGDVLSNFQKIKDLAKTQPTGILTKSIMFIMRKAIWDPMNEAKGDLQNELSSAINSYKSAQDVLNKQNEIKDFQSANIFLTHLYYGQAHEEAALYLFQKIFKNYGTIVLKVEPFSAILSIASPALTLIEFPKLVAEAAAVLDWLTDVNCQYILKEYDIQAELSYGLSESGKYTLKLAQASSEIKDYEQQYLKHREEGVRRAAECYQGVADYLQGFDLGDFFSSLRHVKLFSPAELKVRDSQGRVTGIVMGEIKEEIPNSVYEDEGEILIIFSPSDLYGYEVVGIDEGVYGLGVTRVKAGGANNFGTADVPTSSGAVHEYTIDWESLSEGEEGVTTQKDSDGDGDFEETIVTSQPNTPSSPSPLNHATNVSTETDLTWGGGDPDVGDIVTYDVYFGTSSTAPLRETIGPYAADQTSISYNPGPLSRDTRYHWKIVARDNQGIIKEGPMWGFTTISPPSGEALASIEDKLVIAYGYKVGEGVGGWTVYNPEWAVAHPDWNSLTTLYVQRGYWINVSGVCDLTYGANTYEFDEGWNLIGWCGAAAVSPPSDEDNPPAATAFASLEDELVMAYGFKAGEGVGGWTVYNPEWAVAHPDWNSLTTLYVQRGYWINVSGVCDLTYGANTYEFDEGWNLIGWMGY